MMNKITITHEGTSKELSDMIHMLLRTMLRSLSSNTEVVLLLDGSAIMDAVHVSAIIHLDEDSILLYETEEGMLQNYRHGRRMGKADIQFVQAIKGTNIHIKGTNIHIRTVI